MVSVTWDNRKQYANNPHSYSNMDLYFFHTQLWFLASDRDIYLFFCNDIYLLQNKYCIDI